MSATIKLLSLADVQGLRQMAKTNTPDAVVVRPVGTRSPGRCAVVGCNQYVRPLVVKCSEHKQAIDRYDQKMRRWKGEPLRKKKIQEPEATFVGKFLYSS